MTNNTAKEEVIVLELIRLYGEEACKRHWKSETYPAFERDKDSLCRSFDAGYEAGRSDYQKLVDMNQGLVTAIERRMNSDEQLGLPFDENFGEALAKWRPK